MSSCTKGGQTRARQRVPLWSEWVAGNWNGGLEKFPFVGGEHVISDIMGVSWERYGLLDKSQLKRLLTRGSGRAQVVRGRPSGNCPTDHEGLGRSLADEKLRQTWTHKSVCFAKYYFTFSGQFVGGKLSSRSLLMKFKFIKEVSGFQTTVAITWQWLFN